MSTEDRVAQVLEADGSSVRGVFRVAKHPQYGNIAVCEHQRTRGSASHVYEDLHDAEVLLRAAGFTALRDGWAVCARIG